MYLVKTRNWNRKKWVVVLLKLTCKIGVKTCDVEDYDNKFWIETTNPVKAWCIWAYFMVLRCFSGGWTYIQTPSYKGDWKGYKSILR